MSGKSKLDITKTYRAGEVRLRSFGYYGTFHMYCDRCMERRDTGLGGGPAVTLSDLCVGAMVDGWSLTQAGQYCDACAPLRRVRFIQSPAHRYAEWWMRKSNPLVFAAAHSCGLSIFLSGVSYVLARLST